MGALKRNFATLLVVTVICGLLPLPASAHRMFERVYDPSTGDTYRQSVPHRHRADGSIVVLDGARSYSTYAPSTYTPYYSSSYYRPYGYSSGYRGYYDNGYGYSRRGGSSVGPALLGAGIGYAIGRGAR